MGKQVVSDKTIGLGDVVARIRVSSFWQDGADTGRKSISLCFYEPDCCAEGSPYRPGQYIEIMDMDLKKFRDFLIENLPKD